MTDPIQGNTISWKFEDGPTAGKTFEHEFKRDRTLSYKMDGGDATTEKHYELAKIGESMFVVSYLASSGWTLTTILDFDTHKATSFASNNKQLVLQHGTFHVMAKRAA